MFWISIFVLVVIALIPLVGVAVTVDDWSRDLSTNVAETSAGAADVQMRPLPAQATFDQLVAAANQIASSSQSWEFNDSDPDIQSIYLVHVSGLLKFRDDVALQLKTIDQKQAIHIRSQSRIGKGDLGQNPRNIRKLRGLLEQELESAER